MPPSQHECGTLRGSESVYVCRGDRVTARASFCCQRFRFPFLPVPPYPFLPPSPVGLTFDLLACIDPHLLNLQMHCLPRWHLSYLFASGPDTGAWGQSIPPLPTPVLPSCSTSTLWTPCPAPVPGLCTQLPKVPSVNVKRTSLFHSQVTLGSPIDLVPLSWIPTAALTPHSAGTLGSNLSCF